MCVEVIVCNIGVVFWDTVYSTKAVWASFICRTYQHSTLPPPVTAKYYFQNLYIWQLSIIAMTFRNGVTLRLSVVTQALCRCHIFTMFKDHTATNSLLVLHFTRRHFVRCLCNQRMLFELAGKSRRRWQNATSAESTRECSNWLGGLLFTLTSEVSVDLIWANQHRLSYENP